MIIILGPPPSVAYPFILDVEGYPQQIINFFIVCVSSNFFFSIVEIDLEKKKKTYELLYLFRHLH